MRFFFLHYFSRRNLLILISLLFIINNVIWWQKNKFIQGPDEGAHLSLSINLFDFKEDPRQALSYFSNAPFYYFTANIFYKIFQNTSYHISMLNNILYIILLLIGVSKLETLFLNTSGIFSPFFLMFIPAIGVHSRFFNPDIALCSVIVWFIYFLKRMNDTVKFKYFIILLLLIFLGGYTKITFYVFSVFPILCYFCLTLQRRELNKAMYNIALGILLLISFCIIYPSIFNHIIYGRFFYKAENLIHNVGYVLSDPGISLEYVRKSYLGKISEAIFLIINSQLSRIIFIFFIFSFIVFINSHIKREDKLNIILFFLGNLFIFPIIRPFHLEARYFLPFVVFEVIIISYGIHFLFRRKKVFKFFVIIFLIFSIMQYYGISYSKNWIEFFSRIKVFNKIINLTYYPFSSHKGVILSLPYPDNPVVEIVNILYDNFKNGISCKVDFLGNDARDPFFLFISQRLNYYALRRGLPNIDSEDIYDVNFLIVRDSYVKDKENICHNAFEETGLEFGGIYFKKFCEKARFQFYRRINIYNPLTERNEPFLLYLRNNRNFIAEEIRRTDNSIEDYKLFIILQNNKILTSDTAITTFKNENELSLEWPEDNFSMEARIECKANGDIILKVYSDKIKDIKLIQVIFPMRSDHHFYYYDENGFKLIKGERRRSYFVNNRRFTQGIKIKDALRYFIFIPEIPRNDYFSQIDLLNKREISIVYGLKPYAPNATCSNIFSLYIVKDLKDYESIVKKAKFLESKLFITLQIITSQNSKVLTIDPSRATFKNENELSLEWPEDNFLMEARIEPNNDMMFDFYSDKIKDIQLISIKKKFFYKPPLYYYDNGDFTLFKGSPRRLILKNSYEFCKGLKIGNESKYSLFIPRVTPKVFLSQIYINKENNMDIVYNFKPTSENNNLTNIFSFYLVNDLRGYKEKIKEKVPIKKELKVGESFKFSFELNTFKVYFQNKEITKCFGLYLSILQKFWHDPQDVLWSIESFNDDNMVVIGEYLNLPVSQKWIIKKEDTNTLSIDVILIVKDTINIEEIQTALMLNSNYNDWDVKYLNKCIKNGKFTSLFGNSWKIIWQGVGDSMKVKSNTLPSLYFVKDNKESLCNKAKVVNTDNNFKAFTLMYYCQPKKILEKGEYLCFSGKIQLEN